MQFKAVLGNAKHPEYGVANIPFPIPNEQYESTMEMMRALEIGDALVRDCRVEEITHGWPILKRLEKIAVNIDELDYLAKRLAQLEAAFWKSRHSHCNGFDVNKACNCRLSGAQI